MTEKGKKKKKKKEVHFGSDLVFHLNFIYWIVCWIKMAHQIAPSVNCSLDEIDLNALKVKKKNVLFNLGIILAGMDFFTVSMNGFSHIGKLSRFVYLHTVCVFFSTGEYCRGVVKNIMPKC